MALIPLVLAIANYASKAFQIGRMLLEAGKDAKAFFDAQHAAVEKMKAEERGPTDEEWAALDKLHDELHAEIQNAKP